MTIDCADNTVEYLYLDQTEQAFQGYLDQLEQSGMARYGEVHSFGNALKAATYCGNEKTVHTYFSAADGTVRVLVTTGNVSLPPIAKGNTVANISSNVAMLGLNRENGLSMVFTLEDSSYLIYDGGENSADADLLYQYLKENNRRADDKLVIAGWFFTHEHTDHYGMFGFFAANYGWEVTLEYIFVNGYSPNSVNPAITTYVGFLSDQPDGTPAQVKSLSKKFLGDPVTVKVHTGQVISLRNADIQILFTNEDLTPENAKVATANDLSTVSMVCIGGKKILVAGDAVDEALFVLATRYAGTDVLQCDILQIPHHGLLGGNSGYPKGGEAFLALAKPKTVLFPTDDSHFETYRNYKFNVKALEFANDSYATASEVHVFPLAE